jgi:hypothetical protein
MGENFCYSTYALHAKPAFVASSSDMLMTSTICGRKQLFLAGPQESMTNEAFLISDFVYSGTGGDSSLIHCDHCVITRKNGVLLFRLIKYPSIVCK